MAIDPGDIATIRKLYNRKSKFEKKHESFRKLYKTEKKNTQYVKTRMTSTSAYVFPSPDNF